MQIHQVPQNRIRRLLGIRGPMLVAAVGVVSVALVLLLGGCGEATPASTDLTAGSSTSTTPPVTVSPIAASGLPKLVDLGSDSCVPCQLMAPELEELAQEYAGRLDVVIVDVYEDEALARELRIRVIPTQLWFDPEGNELLRHDGYISKEDIVSRFAMLGYPLTDGSPSTEDDSASAGGDG